MKCVKNINDVANAIRYSDALRQKMIENPEEALEANFRFIPDTPVYRYVVIFLGLTVMFVILGYFTMPLTKMKELDSAIITLASAAIGALTGLLAPQPK